MLNAVVIYIFYPETKKLSLEELDFFFANRYGNGAEVKEIELERGMKDDVVQIEEAAT